MSLSIVPSVRPLRERLERLLRDRRFQTLLFFASLVAFWLLQAGVAWAN